MTDSVTNQGDGERPEDGQPQDHAAAQEPGVDAEETVETLKDELLEDGVHGVDADAEALDAAESPEGAVEDGDVLLEALRRDYDELNDRHLRLAAEFNNYRRRTEQERLDLWARAQAEFVGRLLDVLDDLQRVAALDLDNATVEGIMEGIDLVERKFVRVLEDAGAEVIDPVGEAFDPERMEAMMRVPAESEEDDDTVQQVFQKGYSFKGQLVRAARVSVLKHG